MALVHRIERQALDRDVPHKTAHCTYSIVVGLQGEKFLQVDTYGSADRKIKGKKSQSIRFSPDAVASLWKIIQEHGFNRTIRT